MDDKQQILQEELEVLKAELIAKYHELDMKASGTWEATLAVSTEATAGGLRGFVRGEDYSYYMQHGRAAGRMPPVAAIEAWVIAKGLQGVEKNARASSLAWAIAKKIAQLGTRRYQAHGTPAFIEAVVTPERIQQIIDKVGIRYLADFKSMIINFFKTLN